MKKIIFICLLLTLILSCSKDDNNINPDAPESIVGTTWEAVITENTQGVTVTLTVTLDFAEINGNLYVIGSGSNGFTYSDSSDFTYTYSSGSGTLSIDDSLDNFTVSGNILNVSGGASAGGISLNGDDIDFIKQ